MTVVSARRPAKRYRTSTHASNVPITAFRSAATAEVQSVNVIAGHAAGDDIACRNVANPSPKPFVMTATTGSAIRRQRYTTAVPRSARCRSAAVVLGEDHG